MARRVDSEFVTRFCQGLRVCGDDDQAVPELVTVRSSPAQDRPDPAAVSRARLDVTLARAGTSLANLIEHGLSGGLGRQVHDYSARVLHCPDNVILRNGRD